VPEVRELQPDGLTRDEWTLYHAYRRRRHSDMSPEDPLVPDDIEELLLSRPDSRWIHARWMLLEGGEVVSVLRTELTNPESPEYATNRHLMWAEAHVLDTHRGRGFGRSWLRAVIDEMDSHGATVMTSAAHREPGHRFLRRLGAEPRLTERESRLDLAAVDWDMVARWAREGPERSAGATLELHDRRVPDGALAELCDAVNELINTIPFEDMDHGEIVQTADNVREWYGRLDAMGSAHHTCVMRDREGAIVGVTDVLKHPHEAHLVRQLFTGVHPRARGRGLGKWLKAAMLQHVRRVHPEATTVETGNARSNDPMLAINHALGFRLHRTWTYYQVGRDALRAAVP